MIDIDSFLNGLELLFEWQNFLLMILGMGLGIIFGSIPGLTGSLGIAMMLPLTFAMDPLPAFVFLLSIYTGGLFGGAVTAILLNTPGSPAAIATTLDGYSLTKKGLAGRALGLAVGASSIGGLLGVITLLFIIQPLASIALQFGPTELFMVAVFGLTIIAALQGDSFTKTMYAGLFGILLGTIGMTAGGVQRGTFDMVSLMDGIPLIPALIGLFAVSELFLLADKGYIGSKASRKQNDSIEILNGIKSTLKYPFNILRSSAIGVFIGAIPAAGSSIASLISYNEARRASKRKKEFGKGSEEGLIAAESANNASEGGSLATMLVLGIPGSAATAMLLGAVIMQGWVPGPRLFIDNSDVLYGVLFSEVIQEVLLLIMGAAFCIVAGKIIKIPTSVLIPIVVVFIILGSFALRNLMFDAVLVFLFGILGWYLRKYKYPVIAVVLGLVLGPIADSELMRAVEMYGDQTFFAFFQRPISLIMVIVTVAAVASPYIMKKVKQRFERNVSM